MAVVGLTIGIDADTKKFNKEIKKMDKSIRNTNQEIYSLTKSLDIKWDSKKFVRAQKLAQDSLTQTQVKVQSLRDRLKYLDETGTGKTTAEYEAVQRSLARAELQADQFAQKLKKIKDLKIEKLAGSFDKVGASIENAGKKMLPFSATAGAVLVSFAKIGLSAIEAGDDIATLSTSINLSAEELQKWNYIAEQTDVGTEKFIAGTVKIQDALSMLAREEVGGPADALLELGLTSEEASLGMEANLEKIINALSALEDETQQVALANEIFGTKLGASFIPLLKAGEDGISDLSSEFESFGYLTNEQVESLGELDGTLDKLKYGFETIKNQLGVALVPLMTTLASVIQTKVIPFIQQLAEWFASLSEKQMQMIFGILAFVTALAPMLIMIGKMTKGIGGLIKMAGGLQKALTLLAAHPIILVIGIIIGLMALLYAKNEEFRNSVNGLFQQLKSALMPILKIIGDLFINIVNALMPLVNILLNLLAPALTRTVKIISFLVGILSKVLVPYLQFLGKVWGEVFGFIPKIVEGVVDAVEWMVNSVIGLINDLIDKVNKVGKYVGIEIDKLEDIEIEIATPKWDTPEAEAGEFGGILEGDPIPIELDAESVVGVGSAGDLLATTSPTTNIDASTKDIEINVTVENYGTEIDEDVLADTINRKLLEAM